MAMKQDKKELLAGSLTFIVFILFFFYVFVGEAEEKGASPFSSSYIISATFKDTDGIGVGSSVMLAGILVGSVSSIELTSDFRSLVKLSVLKDVLLPEDTALSIQSDGLFGMKYIDILPGGDEEYIALTNGYVSYTQDSMRLSDILDKVVSYAKLKIKECNKCLSGKNGDV